jgi:hypothetical protein
MKKFALITGTFAVLALLGAGCAGEPTTNSPQQSSSPAAQTPAKNSAIAGLKEMPAITPPAEAIDDSAWKTTATRAGVTVKMPIKGPFAPNWTYTLLDNNDPHLKGNCYVTDATVYKDEASFADFTDACQTTSELNPGPGERTDYFVFQTSYPTSKGAQATQTNLITLTKSYSTGFDMNAYSAVVQQIFKIIKSTPKL